MKRSTLIAAVLCLVLLLGSLPVYAEPAQEDGISPATISYFKCGITKSGSSAIVNYHVESYGSSKIVVTVQMERNVNGSWVNYGSANTETYKNVGYVLDSVSMPVSDSGTFRAKITVDETSTTGQTVSKNGTTQSMGW